MIIIPPTHEGHVTYRSGSAGGADDAPVPAAGEPPPTEAAGRPAAPADSGVLPAVAPAPHAALAAGVLWPSFDGPRPPVAGMQPARPPARATRKIVPGTMCHHSWCGGPAMFILSQKVIGSLRRTHQSTAARSRTSEGRREPQERSSRFALNQTTRVHVTNITASQDLKKRLLNRFPI